MDPALVSRNDRETELKTSSLSAPMFLRGADRSIRVASDGSVDYLLSLPERRRIFGRESVSFCKTQAGIKVVAPRPDWVISCTPRSIGLRARLFDAVDVSQTLALRSDCPGMTRVVRLRNGGRTPLRVSLLQLSDPTGANFHGDDAGWGSAAVNAFNRLNHVAMDEFANPPSARVVGCSPQPRSIYMTTDKGRAKEAMRTFDVPDSTTGMSGQVMLLTLVDLDVPPGAEKEVVFASVYNPTKLEDALADFKRSLETKQDAPAEQAFACSDPTVNYAFEWAKSALRGYEFGQDRLELLEEAVGALYLDPKATRMVVESQRALMGRNGSLPHSLDWSVPGLLETAIFLSVSSRMYLVSRDKKSSKRAYPSLKRCAVYLASSGESASVSKLPVGWRRLIGSGYPDGVVSEVLLAVSSALTSFSELAASLGKSEDAAAAKEKAELKLETVRKKLVNDEGFLALDLQPSGSANFMETVDQAVACYRDPFDRTVCSAVVHRLLAKDFETGYGPRTIPTSNRLLFNPSYGGGLLGGYWTRAAVAHALLSYSSGYPGIGSLELQKLARLVCHDVVTMGGSPGSFPTWLDPESRKVHGFESDPVAAARFVEALSSGELGLSVTSSTTEVNPPAGSTLGWLLFRRVWLGSDASVFVGRREGARTVFAAGEAVETKAGRVFTSFQSIDVGDPAIAAGTFCGPGQALVAGNSSGSLVRGTLKFKPMDPGLSKQISAEVRELDQKTLEWKRVGTARVVPLMSVDFALEPRSWKAFQISAS